MNGHIDDVVELAVFVGEWEVMVVVNREFFFGVLHQAEGVVHFAAYSEVDGAGSVCLAQLLQGFVDVGGELKGVADCVVPWFAETGLVLICGLASDFLSDANVLAETSDTPDESGPADVGEGLRAVLLGMVNYNGWKVVDGCIEIPIKSTEMQKFIIFGRFSPGPKYRAPSLGILRYHIDLNERIPINP